MVFGFRNLYQSKFWQEADGALEVTEESFKEDPKGGQS